MSKNENMRKILPDDEVSLFCEQAALILKSGVPIAEGMEALTESDGILVKDEGYNALIETIQQHDALADGLEASHMFPAYMVQLVRIGEITGKLEDVMNALAAYYRRESAIRKSLKSAVGYPMMLLIVLAAVIVILVTQVMPIFSRVFAGLGAQMDATMSGVARFGTTLGVIVMVLIGLALLGVIGFAVMYKVKGSQKVKDTLGKMFMPFGKLFQTLSRARFASAMSLMNSAGLPIEEALSLAKALPFDEKTLQKLDVCENKLTQQGLELPDALSEAALFEPIHLKMVKAGYTAGQMDTAMERVAEIYQERTDEDIRRMVGMIEPTLVAILALAIGGILLSVMLPLASIMTTIL